jgi:hypothetical protein
MRALRLALLALLLTPAATRAGDVAIVQRDLPLGRDRGLASAPPPHFNMLGVHWRGSGRVLYRVHRLDGRWAPWVEADADTAPDTTSPEARRTRGWHDANLVWTGAADGLRYRVEGDVARVRVYYLWSRADARSSRRLSIAGTPSIVSRVAWGADEEIRRAKPRYAPAVRFAVIHHTAGSNSYSRAQSAAIVRGIEAYHVKANGWDDIGYNFLVDRYGRIFEGRYGGVDRPVIGAHAEGFNTGSVGISLIGTYSTAQITPAQRTALVKLLAWRLDVAHVDPLATIVWRSSGNPKFRAGKAVTLHTISGHRDTGFTDCPGNALYGLLPSIAKAVAGTGLPKLYDPAVLGRLGGKVRFTARLSSSIAWTVRVTDGKGAEVASGKGTGTAVDWTWDSSRAPKGVYAWSIEGPGVRPAKGSLGATVAAPTLFGVGASPAVVLPSAPGATGATTISFALGAAGRVTVVVADASGATVAKLLDERLEAGSQSLDWAAGVFPDGRYTVRVTASPPGRAPAGATVEVVVDRTMTGFAASSAVVSPNGDGVADTTTFSFGLTVAATARLEIVEDGAVVGTVVPFGQLQPGPYGVDWNGTADGVPLADGGYEAVLTVTEPFGDVSLTTPIQVDTTPPVLELLDGATLRFRLSEPATVTLLVNGNQVVKVEPAGVFSVPRGAAPVQTVSAVATDAAGNASAAVSWP